MKSKVHSIVVIFLFIATTFTVTGNPKISQWRGPQRDGKYPETGLMKEWPAQGPEMVWLFEGLGAGQSSPVIADNFIYVTGIPDTITGEAFLFKLDLQGNQVWKKGYGRDFTELFPGARSNPPLFFYFILQILPPTPSFIKEGKSIEPSPSLDKGRLGGI